MSRILFELGCEELPPKSLKTLQDSLKSSLEAQLQAANIGFEQIQAFAAPRRLAVMIEGVADKQPDRIEQKRGPALKAAFDANGQPSKAAQGFAQGLGVSVSDLITLHTDKGDYVGLEQTLVGQPTKDLLPAMLQKALDDLPIAKRMRSGADKETFVRPVQWVLLMQDDQVIEATIQGHKAGRKTRGHRFHAPDFYDLDTAENYEKLLTELKVMADFDKRQKNIVDQVNQLAESVKSQAIMPQDLLDEVTALVDWPVALRANFEERFLQVPQEALISTMQADQKYFCLTDHTGKLQPYFIFISNIESTDPAQVIAGNEKVVRPRLADAEFFFLQDQKQSLSAWTEQLKTRIFQDQLGTLWDKSERIAKLAAFIATLLKDQGKSIDVEETVRAAMLAKADLATSLVGEFPELQGIAGTYYARLNGESEPIACAIEEQYLPRFSGDTLPQSPIGICLALADRLDTLVGIFGINQAPTGSKDPFSLRRLAIGVLRILIENQLPINLVALVEHAIKNYQNNPQTKLNNLAETFTQVMEFIQSRYRAMYTEQGIKVDTILAVQAINPHMPLDFDQRIHAVQAFRSLPQAQSLAESNKRVANILAKAEQNAQNPIPQKIDEKLLQEPAEIALNQAINQTKQAIQPLLAHNPPDYTQVLNQLVGLEEPLTRFFDQVMVNAENDAIKQNRLALLKQVRTLFLSVADISELQI